MVAEVQPSRELDRIIALPRRVWTPDQRADLVEALTAALSVRALDPTPHPDSGPNGKGCTACHAGPGRPCVPMRLLPLQAVALAEIATWGGALVPIPVGFGKTLVSGLAPRMVGRPVERPLLLVPAHLASKTARELQDYRRHWVLPPFIRIETYQKLSVVGSADFFREYDPDQVTADEGHYLKNPHGPRWRRLSRHLRASFEAGRHVPYVDLTGTLSGGSLRDFAHRASYALLRSNPCPEDGRTLDEWARHLDAVVPPTKYLGPGALTALLAPEDEGDCVRAFGRRLAQTPGVVLSDEPQLAIPIKVTAHRLELDPPLVDAFQLLREHWKTPDDQDADDGQAVWRNARELASGFFSRWVPKPPDDWKDARRDWSSACREILANNRRELDTADQLIRAIDAHPDWYPEEGRILARWREIEPTFTPNPIATWVSDRTIDWIVAWARKAPGLIWTDRPVIGQRLAARGLPYYSNEGIDASTGRFVEAHRASEGSIVLARKANDSGRNLQREWSRNLLVDIPAGGKEWEQLAGRTHRQGQPAPIVTFDLAIGCVEDVEAFWSAYGKAGNMGRMTTQPQKLLHANLDEVPDLDEVATWTGPQWKKSKPPARSA